MHGMRMYCRYQRSSPRPLRLVHQRAHHPHLEDRFFRPQPELHERHSGVFCGEVVGDGAGGG